MDLPLSPQVFILAVSFLIATLLYLREYNLRKRQSLEQEKISKDIREKGAQMLQAAEMAEERVITDSEYSTARLEEEYGQKLQQIFTSSQETIKGAQTKFMGHMLDLQKRSEDFEQAAQSTSQQRINQLFQRLENRLTDFLTKTETSTTSSIELELKAARQMIETYKAQQLKLIDENIIAMMEQTLIIVLAKKLSLKDQLDLVYEALEKAKVDKFVV